MIELQSVTKSFGGTPILRELNLTVRKKEILSLLGPNGCGKTTVLNIISGLSRPDKGNVIIDDVFIDGQFEGKTVHVPPSARKVGYVFQTTALFPHMRVVDNVAYGLKAKHYSKQEIRVRTRSLLDFVGMREYAEYFPHQISGGQKQRVALARSLAADPEVLLLDEPISAVDSQMRESLRLEFKRLLRELKITAIYVTHDLTEALLMSDRVAVMGNGQIEQTGNRHDILNRPNSKYVAEFLGLNVYNAKVIHDSSGQIKLEIAEIQIFSPQIPELGKKPVLVTLKPEDVILSSESSFSDPKWSNCTCNILKGTIIEIILMKSVAQVTVDVGFLIKSELTLNSLNDLNLCEGNSVCVQFKANDLNVLPIKNSA